MVVRHAVKVLLLDERDRLLLLRGSEDGQHQVWFPASLGVHLEKLLVDGAPERPFTID